MCQKDINLKGDGKTCGKTQIPQGECFVGPLKKYIFVSGMQRRAEFFFLKKGPKLYLYSRLRIFSYSCRHTGKVFYNSFL